MSTLLERRANVSGMKLSKEWKRRLILWVEGNKLHDEGDKLYAGAYEVWAEGHKLYIKGDKLYAKGDKLWTKAILGLYGDIKIEWKNWNRKYQSYECHLENGEVYGFEMEEKSKLK